MYSCLYLILIRLKWNLHKHMPMWRGLVGKGRKQGRECVKFTQVNLFGAGTIQPFLCTQGPYWT
jgi:hypothetical protein